MPVSVEAQIGIALRTLMNSNGFSSTKIIGYEHNWSDAANYPVQLVRDQMTRDWSLILTLHIPDAASRERL